MRLLIERAVAAHEAGYDVVACHGKAPITPGWERQTVTANMIEGWNGNSHITNIGIRTGDIVGVDIDIHDAARSERVKNLALQILGDTNLVRIGQNPKQLLVYRVAIPFRKKQITGEMNPDTGKPHKVEVLAQGQQFVAYGRHPDTLQPYVWPETDLAAVPAKDVPIATEEALQAFLVAAQEIIGQPPRAARAVPVQGHRLNRHDDTPLDKTEAVEALYAIPGDLEYDEWIRVGFALYAALGSAGYSHWMDWSARSTKNVPITTARKWPTFAQGREIHAETLFWISRDHGWRPEREKGGTAAELGIFKGKPPLPRHDPETGEILEDEEVAEPVASSATTVPALAFTPYTRLDPGKIPPRRFLYGRHYIRQFLSTDISPGGIGKSSLVIAEAMAMAAHRDLLGSLPTERVKVAYWNGEDPIEELQRRVEAVALHYGIKPEETDGHLFVDSGRMLQIILAHDERKGTVLNKATVDAIITSIKSSGIDVLIIDPFISSHRVNENDNNAIDLVAKAWSHIADVTGCSINLVHHSRKLNGEEVTVDSGRGASALNAACRSARTLNQMTKDEAARLGVENHRLYFRVDDGKTSMMPPPEGAVWHQLVSVDLPNGPMGTVGDKVGVVTRWGKPDPMGQLTSRDLLAVQNAVGAGKWRDNTQARDWVGKAVAQALGLALPEEVVRVKFLIQTWLRSGALTIVRGLDAKRMPRDYVEVGNWIELDD